MPRHAAQWTATIKTPVDPLVGKLLVRGGTRAHTIQVLDFGARRGLRDDANPARRRGNLGADVPKPERVAKVRHHAVVAVSSVAGVMARLRQQHGMAARALAPCAADRRPVR